MFYLFKFNLTNFFLTFFVFCVSKVIVYALIYSFGCIDLSSNCFSHWDSGHYISIAKEGHKLYQCGSQNWCGNTGWSPLYPFIMQIINKITNFNFEICGVIVSSFFYFFYLLLISYIFNFNKVTFNALVTLFLFAFFPGFIYLHAVFPISLCMFLLSGIILNLQKKNFLYSGIFSMFLVWSYASGFFILLPFMFYLTYLFFLEKKITFAICLKLLFPFFSSLLLLFLYEYFQTGHWNAIFLIQKQYGHSLFNPFSLLKLRMWKLKTDIFNTYSIIHIQSFFVLSIVLLLISTTIKEFFRNIIFKPELFFYFGLMLIYWFLPYSMGIDISLHRGCILLSPLLILWNSKSLDFKILLLISFGIFVIPMVAFFYKNIMV